MALAGFGSVFLALGFLTIVSSVNHEEKLVNIIQSHQSWQSSARLCEQTNNRLVTLKSVEEFLDVQRQLQDFTNRSYATFWIGGREIKSLWVWSHDQRPQIGRILGCMEGPLPLVVSSVLQNNFPELCTAFCKVTLKRQFAALQGSRCYCLYDTASLRETEIQDCNTPCPGNQAEFCGGLNRSSVFSTWDSVEWGYQEPSLRINGKDCALLLHSGTNSEWSTEYCRQKHEFICHVEQSDVCDWLNQPTPCLYAVSEKMDWYSASHKCNQLHGYLVDRDAILHHNLNLSNVYYWTGLTRTRQIWTDGSTIDLSLRRHIPFLSMQEKLCIALQYRQSEGWGLASTDCNKKYPALCQPERKYAIEDIQAIDPPNGPAFFNNDSHTTLVKTTTEILTTSDRETHYLQANLMYWILIPTVSMILLFLFVLLVGVYVKRSKKTKTTEEKVIEPFYYILEKQTPRPYSGVYNHIFLENQYILNYNHLHFNGTLKQMVQDSTAITTAEENSDIHPNYYDTMHCKLHQYDRVSRGKVKVYCVQGLYETVM